MENKTIHPVIIIGSGPAGLTAAIYTARAFLKPLVFQGSKPGGQLMGTTAVENWPGNKSILGPELMMRMQEQAQHLGAELISETVTSVDLSDRPFSITTARAAYLSRSLIIATGASPNMIGCPGEQDYWGKGVATCAVCDGAFYRDKKVVILGGGDTAMEDASFMTAFTSDITVVHILDKFTASPVMQERVLKNNAIKKIFSSTVSRIMGDGTHVQALEIENVHTKEKTELKADVLFLAIGQKPNTALFTGQLEMDKMGYLKLIERTCSSKEGVFVAGDVADYRYKQAIVSAGAGCMAALDCQRYLEAHQ